MRKQYFLALFVVLLSASVYAVDRSTLPFIGVPSLVPVNGASYTYDFVFSSSNTCSPVLLNVTSTLVSDSRGVVSTDISLTGLNSTPAYLCEYVAGSLLKVDTLFTNDFNSMNTTISGLGYNTTNQLTTLYDSRYVNTITGAGLYSNITAIQNSTVAIFVNGSSSVVVTNNSPKWTFSFQNATNLQDGFLTAVDHTQYSGTYTFLNNVWASYQQLNASLISIGNWTNDKTMYTNTSNMNTAIANAITGKFDKTGGNIVGNVVITGNLTLIGDTFTANVTNQSLNGTFLPSLNSVFNLGSPSLHWANLYADNTYDKTTVNSLGNWSADKANYALITYVNSAGNWTADKGSYTASSLLVGALGNWSADKANYALITYVNSVGNWSNDKSSYALVTFVTSAGNWTQDKPSYTTSNNLVIALGNWTADKGSYTASSLLVGALGNWSADKASYTTTANADSKYRNQSANFTCVAGSYLNSVAFNLDGTQNASGCSVDQTGAAISYWQNITDLQNSNQSVNASIRSLNASVISIGNWTNDKGSYALITYVNSAGNWTADKGSYTASSLLVGALGNWSADKSSYRTLASSDGVYQEMFANGVANQVLVWTNTTNATSYLVNATMLNISLLGTSGQPLHLNSTGGMAWSGDVNMTNNSVTDAKTVTFKMFSNANGTVPKGNLTFVDWSKGALQNVTLVNPSTVTFIAPSGPARLTLILKQDATGSRLVTWNSTIHIDWQGAAAPTLTTTASREDIVTCIYDGKNSTELYMCGASLNFG